MRVFLGKCCFHCRNVATVTVNEEIFLKSRFCQRCDIIPDYQYRVCGRRLIVPGKLVWCKAIPTLIVGPIKALAASPTPQAIALAAMASVPIKPVGPCCSVEPIGIIMPRELSR